MHEQWISNVAIEYARAGKYAQLRMQLQEVWGGDSGVMHVFISGWQNQQGLEPRGGLAPAYLAIPRRNRSLPSNTESEMQPKPNPFKTRHLSILSTLRAPSPRSPISSFNPGCTPPISSNVFDYHPHFCWILDHNFPFFSLQPLQKQSCIFRLKDRGPHLFIEITIRSRRGDLRCQITSIYLQYKTA